uniref:Mediator of DNA damage checkpoint protein 1 n=1 Tax=Stomoxys calcitrans TaxID=35570 RepID=A0A1I8PFY4_STOCA
MEASHSPVMYVDISGQRYPLELGLIYLFGKKLPSKDHEGESKIVFNIEKEDVDERHCCVMVSVSEDVYVFDLFSSHGTFLNGERLKPLDKMCVKNGDVMKLGLMQSVRFYHEQLEMSHDSSGFGDNNKNNSDIIGSSPESTSQKESRLKRLNNQSNDNFLVPAVPPIQAKPSRYSSSFLVPETESLSSSRRSSLDVLNSSQHKKRDSDSFIIPETQHSGGRTSTGSNLSIAESIPDEEKTKSGINLNVSENEDDDFCIPETQEMVMNSERPRLLKDNPQVNNLKTLEEKSVDLNDSEEDETDDAMLGGSQIRICTQDFNDGFGEEENMSIQSQVIPIIRHNPVLLNGSSVTKSPVIAVKKANEDESSTKPQSTAFDEEDREVANINWSTNQQSKSEEEANNLNCTTPDLFDCQALENGVAPLGMAENEVANDVNLFENDANPALEDEEDYMATQLFPISNNSAKKVGDKPKATKDKNIFNGKEDEPFLTLSDKENMHPDRIEPISELPPTQLFATGEVANERSSASTFSRKSSQHNVEDKPNASTVVLDVPATINNEQTGNGISMAELMPDEEDDILTQAFVPPPPPPSKSMPKAATKDATPNYFNSTLLDDRPLDKNPASFFAEMEKTPKKDILSSFKLPEKTFSAARKTSSAASTTSTDSDMDLLFMCTPQLIKEHMPYSKSEDLKKTILAAKNKNLFGEDTDEGEDFQEIDEKKTNDNCLVQLINVPKESKDFDRLLPHLKLDNNNVANKKNSLSLEQQAVKEAAKEYKFRISFGHEHSSNDTKTNNKSSTLSRDERHATRDKEKEKRKIHNGGDEKRKTKTKNENPKLDDRDKESRKTLNDEEHKSSRRNKTENFKKTDSVKEAHKATRDDNKGIQQDEFSKSTSSSLSKEEERDKNAKKVRSRRNTKSSAPSSLDNTSGKTDKEVSSKSDEANSRQHREKENNKKPNSDKTDEEATTTKTNETTSLKEAKETSSTNISKGEDNKEAPNKRSRTSRAVKEKQVDEQKKPTSNTNGKGQNVEVLPAKQTTKRKQKEKEETAVKPTRRNTRLLSANKDDEETQKVLERQRRQTRLRSGEKSSNTSEEAAITKTTQAAKRSTRLKSQASTKSGETSDNLDSILTQPFIRATRTRSRSSQKDNDNEVKSHVSSHLSSSATVNESNSTPNTNMAVKLEAAVNKPGRKRKTDIPAPEQIVEQKRSKRTISQDSCNSLERLSSSSSLSSRPLISITMVEPERFNELNANCKGQWAVAKDPKESDILVMDNSFRTFKFLLAMARGIPIVKSQWLSDINKTKPGKSLPPIIKYMLNDPVFEKKHKFSLETSLQQRRQNKKGIFDGYEFVMTPNIKPSPAEIKAVIEVSGGIVHTKAPPPPKENQKLFLVSSPDDRKDWHKYRRVNSNIIIIATEAIMSAIMRQNCTPLSNHVLA